MLRNKFTDLILLKIVLQNLRISQSYTYYSKKEKKQFYVEQKRIYFTI